MKRLLRLLTVAGAVAGAFWYSRQKAKPEPASTAGEWVARPHLKVVPEVAAPSGTDDLTEIKGIGPKYAQRLAELDITSFAALAAADPISLAESLDARARVGDWITQARARTTA
jgi:predicted flap endonuclease-1-like 5' DNA nuclease